MTVHSVRSGSTSFSQPPLNAADHDALLSLCDDGAPYLVTFKQQGGAKRDLLHRSVASACALVASGLRDVVTVHLDWRSQVTAVNVAAQPPPKGRGNGTSLNDPQPTGFATRVSVQSMETGPQPDTAAFIQKMEQEKLAKQRGETKDNRSFFAKYWMYIIPFVLVLAMGSGNPEGGGGGR